MIDDLIVELEWVANQGGTVGIVAGIAATELKELRAAGDGLARYASVQFDGDSKLDDLLREWNRIAHD